MKVVILAGGFGTRLSEETTKIPKPMVEIGGKPILWHIMKLYSHYGYNEFIICLGYKSYVIKEWFANYFLHNSDLTIDLKNNNIKIHNSKGEDWKVTLIDTGLNTGTAGRLKKIEKYIDSEIFMMTYGDGVSNVNIKELINFHLKNNKLVTLTAVRPESRFGNLKLEGNNVIDFGEKKDNVNSYINGGFFVINIKALNYIRYEEEMWELEPLIKITKDNELNAYFHNGFWKPMDKLYDKIKLEEMINNNEAKWMVWENE